MSKVLAVFGATGQQGGSIFDYVLHDAELSKQYNLRAITRDVDSEKSQQLKKKVDTVQGDASDAASLKRALSGAHTVFAMTNPDFGPNGFETEYNAGKSIADAAVEAGASYIIFSTLPSISDLSGGKYKKVVHFDAKAEVEKYIRGLKIKSAFFSPAVFMQNFQNIPFLAPQKVSEDHYVLNRLNTPKALTSYVDIVGNTGTFVGAILAEPDKYEGKTFCAATASYTGEETAASISKATGKNVTYKQLSPQEFEACLPFAGDIFTEVFTAAEEYGGYWGQDSEKQIAWAVANARGKLTTLDEYLAAHPIQLA